MVTEATLHLALLEAFLNSHGNGGRDDWFVPENPRAFDQWARGPYPEAGAYYAGEEPARMAGERVRELVGADRATEDDVALVRDVRDALLEAILEGHAPDRLDGLAAELPVRLEVAEGVVRLRPDGTGPRAVAAAALLAVHHLRTTGEWGRIRLCRGDSCHWAFMDVSKNRSRVWCDMNTCGAKAKARAYRERRRSS